MMLVGEDHSFASRQRRAPWHRHYFWRRPVVAVSLCTYMYSNLNLTWFILERAPALFLSWCDFMCMTLTPGFRRGSLFFMLESFSCHDRVKLKLTSRLTVAVRLCTTRQQRWTVSLLWFGFGESRQPLGVTRFKLYSYAYSCKKTTCTMSSTTCSKLIKAYGLRLHDSRVFSNIYHSIFDQPSISL